MTPHGEPDPAAGDQDAPHLGERCGGRPPDAPEAGHDIERSVIPRQGVHVSNSQVGVRITVPGHRDQALRHVNSHAESSAQAGQLNRETRAAGDVEQPVACANAKSVVQSHVLPTVGRFAEGGKVHGPSPPALVDPAPALVEPGRNRPILRHDRDPETAGPGITGSSDRPRSTRPSPCPQCKSVTGTASESSGNLPRIDLRARWPSIRASGAPRQ